MDTIYSKLDDWRRKLLDLSKRNPLISTKLGQRGALEFERPTAQSVWQRVVIDNASLTFVWKRDVLNEDIPLFKPRDAVARERPLPDGGTGNLSLYSEDEESTTAQPSSWTDLEDSLASVDLEEDQVLTRLPDSALATRLNRLALNAKTSLDEQGVNILFVTFGLLRWYESPDSEAPFFSPLLLVPVQLSRASRDAPWQVAVYEDEVVPNLCLSEMLRSNFKLDLPELPTDELDVPGAREAYFCSVRNAISVSPRWEVLDKVTLGTFSFQKVAMWKDLGENANRVAGHDLCRAIAGDEAIAVAGPTNLPSPREFDDRIPPQELHTILDCDSSQLEGILAVKNGTSLVLDGPPGTGKSQTIANIIAESLANKKSVLFVSEKAAALEVVKRRLDERSLGDFCLECHSHKANKKDVVAELGRCLGLHAEEYRNQVDDLDRLEEARARLNQYVRSLHKPHGALRLTPFAIQGRLAALKPSRLSRWTVSNVLATDAATLRQITECLTGLARFRRAIEDYEHHPWNGCRVAAFSLTAQDDIQHGFSTLVQAIESLAEPLRVLHQAGFMPGHPTNKDLRDGLDTTRNVLRYPEMSVAWFATDPRSVAQRVVQLDSATVEFRRLSALLPQFRPGTNEIDAWQVLKRLTTPGSQWAQRLQGQTARTIRGERYRVCSVIDDFARIRQRLEAMTLAVDDLAREMHLSTTPPARIGVLAGLVALGKAVAATGLINAHWFDQSRRDVVKALASRCQSELSNADRIRRNLSSRLRPEAFETEGELLAKEAEFFESFWSRLFGAWRRFKARLRELYMDGEFPPVQSVLNDMKHLREFHARTQFVRRTESDNSDILVRDGSGNVRWEIVAAGIEGIEQIERVLKKVPDSLREALAAEGALDREAVSQASQNLEGLLSAFAEHVQTTSRIYSFRDVGPDSRSPKDIPPDVFADWLGDAEAGLGERIGHLDAAIVLLNDSEDVITEELPACAQRFEQLGLLRHRISELAHGLECVIGPTKAPETTDWSDYGGKARWLQSFLESTAEVQREAAIQVITQPELRKGVAKAESQVSSILAGRFDPGWETLLRAFDPDAKVSTGLVISDAPLDMLAQWLQARISDVDRLQEWMSFRETEQTLCALRVEAVLDEIVRGEIPLEEARDAFLARFYRLWLDAVYRNDACLRSFDVNAHEELIDSFRKLDHGVVEGGYKRIRSVLLQDPDRPHSGMFNAPTSSEVGVLLKEVSKKRRHLPLRQLFRRIPTLLRRIKPCVMMSPLAVSTYLDSASKFDVVIFDEASQVRPFDAIGAIYRGIQLVVAGDQKQLPPTTFFDRLTIDDDGGDLGADEEEADVGANLADFESILDVCCSLGMPRKRLRWHYRSRREPLIAFSNHHFYGNELVTFPSVYDADGASAVQFHFVENGRWKSGRSGGVNQAEARETANLVCKHISEHPGESLGVITFNQRQQFAVLDQLEELRSLWPEIEPFFDPSKEEPFFVKNLENVQGDERDRIIISIGYGYDEFGKFAMRFGPLNRQGGERRMNVAVTRAKHQVVLVSSIRGADIDLSRTRSVGASLLRAYLEYAERGIETLGLEVREDSQRESDSEFEDEVERELTLQGLHVRRQVGCGGYRIDLALVHPESPGRYVLGIECDGASYHSSCTARDRDRLRQQVLERLGWRLCRIWSTDWIRNAQRQIERVLSAYHDALKNPSQGSLPSVDTELDSPWTQERPVIRLREATSQLGVENGRYAKIEDVPDRVLQSSILGVLRTYGQTSRDELTRAVAQSLGFRRTGKRIQARIARTIQRLIRDAKLTQSPEKLLSAS